MNVVSIETTDDNEEYLKINKINNQIKLKTIANLIDIAKIIPKYVAMPLPPLNFNQIGKMCPIKHKSPER